MRKMIPVFCLLASATLAAQDYLTKAATERYFNVVRRNLETSADAMPVEDTAATDTPARAPGGRQGR